jgi:hypothetical protein
MPGYLLHQGATVLCKHGAQSRPVKPFQRVKVGGQMIAVKLSLHQMITLCPFTVSGVPSPCLTAKWTSGAEKVRAGGQPVLLQDSRANCIPNNVPIKIVKTQTRVKGK